MVAMMTMQGDELKALRKSAGVTQQELAQLLDITPQYVGMLERGERAIEKRMRELIDLHLRTRVDVSYSEYMDKWTVATTGPGLTREGIGRVHVVHALKSGREDAMDVAAKIMEQMPLARIIVREKPSA